MGKLLLIKILSYTACSQLQPAPQAESCHSHCRLKLSFPLQAESCHSPLQAEDLGKLFRTVMYPRYGPAGNGFLRLHSTYRHDLKIYTSDEGRVQTSAAAFTQGLLDLEGTSLTPILVRSAYIPSPRPLLSPLVPCSSNFTQFKDYRKV